jgi:hypothetical protein
VGRRRLRNTVLDFLSADKDDLAASRAKKQFENADCMTGMDTYVFIYYTYACIYVTDILHIWICIYVTDIFAQLIALASLYIYTYIYVYMYTYIYITDKLAGLMTLASMDCKEREAALASFHKGDSVS